MVLSYDILLKIEIIIEALNKVVMRANKMCIKSTLSYFIGT